MSLFQFIRATNRHTTEVCCASLLFVFTASAQASDVTVDCKALYQQHLKTDLQLPYQQFDQTEHQGFRLLAEQQCDQQAADLIEAYIAKNQAKQSSLRWHIAQLRASSGDYANAIRYANTVLNEQEDFSKNPLRWNDYVKATIAFLERDRKALQVHRDRVVAAAAEHFGNELNGKLLDALLRHFDRDYRYATSHID